MVKFTLDDVVFPPGSGRFYKKKVEDSILVLGKRSGKRRRTAINVEEWVEPFEQREVRTIRDFLIWLAQQMYARYPSLLNYIAEQVHNVLPYRFCGVNRVWPSVADLVRDTELILKEFPKELEVQKKVRAYNDEILAILARWVQNLMQNSSSMYSIEMLKAIKEYNLIERVQQMRQKGEDEFNIFSFIRGFAIRFFYNQWQNLMVKFVPPWGNSSFPEEFLQSWGYSIGF